MKKVPSISSVSVLLLLVLIFFASVGICAEENSDVQSPDLAEIKKNVDDNNIQNNDGNVLDNDRNTEKEPSDRISTTDSDANKDKLDKKVDEQAAFTNDEAASIKHAKAISERNKKNLIESGILKNEKTKKLIVPEKKEPTETKKEKSAPKNINDNITEVKSTEQFAELLNGKVPVLVYFYADWSAPCDLLDKTMTEISADSNGKYEVVKVDADSSYGLCKQHDIKTLPTVILFVDGKEKDRKVGRQIKYQYENMLSSI